MKNEEHSFRLRVVAKSIKYGVSKNVNIVAPFWSSFGSQNRYSTRIVNPNPETQPCFE